MPGGRGRGGRRQGLPGRSYTNRSDLQAGPRQNVQPVRTTPSQTYGEGVAQQRAQQTIPLPQVPPLNAPTARPNEPITAGLAMGAGPGPEATIRPPGAAPSSDPVEILRALVVANPGINELVEMLDEAQTPRARPRYTTTPSPSRRQPGTPMQRGPFRRLPPPGATQEYFGGDNMPSINPNSGETGDIPSYLPGGTPRTKWEGQPPRTVGPN